MVKLDHPQRFSYPVDLYKIKGEVIYNLLGFLLAKPNIKAHNKCLCLVAQRGTGTSQWDLPTDCRH